MLNLTEILTEKEFPFDALGNRCNNFFSLLLSLQSAFLQCRLKRSNFNTKLICAKPDARNAFTQ